MESSTSHNSAMDDIAPADAVLSNQFILPQITTSYRDDYHSNTRNADDGEESKSSSPIKHRKDNPLLVSSNLASHHVKSDDEESSVASRFSSSEYNPFNIGMKIEQEEKITSAVPEAVISFYGKKEEKNVAKLSSDSCDPDIVSSSKIEMILSSPLHISSRGTSSESTASVVVTPLSVKSAKLEYKAETDDEEEEHSSTEKKSKIHQAGPNSNFNDQIKQALETPQSTNNAVTESNPPKIKEEPTIYELQQRQAKHQRKFGDRVLLARQSMKGMMKLGGGNTETFLWPVDPEKHLARMGGRFCMAYNDLWNFGAPKYAGQETAHVTHLPNDNHKVEEREIHNVCDPHTHPFSVFVKRTFRGSALGWEYCGEYLAADALPGFVAARCVPAKTKSAIIKCALRSLDATNGWWHGSINYYRRKFAKICEEDSSPPGPTRLIRLARMEPEPNDEGKERQDRIDRESREKATSAAKIRALGLDKKELSEKEFVKALVHLDDYYESFCIKFVKYDEEMYNFVKEGETTRNSDNKKRNEGEPCAKASDWYKLFDQTLEQNDKRVKRKRKKKQGLHVKSDNFQVNTKRVKESIS